MAIKFIILAAFVVVVRGGVVAPLARAPVAVAAKLSEFDPNPQYSFAYDVQDVLTGDFKSQVESRNGDIVQGQYSVVDPDGTRRIVDYTADSINGFNAIVSKTPLARVVAAAPVVAKAAPVAAAPLLSAPFVAKGAVPVAPVAPAAPLVGTPAISRLAATPLFSARLAAPVAAPLGYNAFPAAPFAYPAGFSRVAAPLAYASL